MYLSHTSGINLAPAIHYPNFWKGFQVAKIDQEEKSGKLRTFELQSKCWNVSASIDPVIAGVKADCEQSRFQTQTYG